MLTSPSDSNINLDNIIIKQPSTNPNQFGTGWKLNNDTALGYDTPSGYKQWTFINILNINLFTPAYQKVKNKHSRVVILPTSQACNLSGICIGTCELSTTYIDNPESVTDKNLWGNYPVINYRPLAVRYGNAWKSPTLSTFVKNTDYFFVCTNGHDGDVSAGPALYIRTYPLHHGQ